MSLHPPTPFSPRGSRTVSAASAISVDMNGPGLDGIDHMYDPTSAHDDTLAEMEIANYVEDDDGGFDAGVAVNVADLDPQLGQAEAGPSSATNLDDMFKAETGMDGDDDDDDDSPAPASKRRRETQDVPGGFTYVDGNGENGRRKIRIEYITDKSRRHITFSKRKAGIMKKAYELSILTGTQVLLLVVSETGLVYTFTTSKLQPLVTKAEGKNLIQACLNAPEGLGPDGQPLTGPVPSTKAKNGGLAIRPHKLTAAATAALAHSSAQAAGQDEAAAAQAAAHARAQAEAAQIGQGQPGSSAASRPKKRLPSSAKKRSASSANGPPADPAAAAGASGELVPPVPPMPDMHRQPSPSTQHLLPPNLQSPLHQPYMHDYHGLPSPTYYPQPGEFVPPGTYGHYQGGQYVVHPMHYQPRQGEGRMMQGM
ncbi:transcription factor of the MADS box [Cryptotrichosporon argae]